MMDDYWDRADKLALFEEGWNDYLANPGAMFVDSKEALGKKWPMEEPLTEEQARDLNSSTSYKDLQERIGWIHYGWLMAMYYHEAYLPDTDMTPFESAAPGFTKQIRFDKFVADYDTTNFCLGPVAAEMLVKDTRVYRCPNASRGYFAVAVNQEDIINHPTELYYGGHNRDRTIEKKVQGLVYEIVRLYSYTSSKLPKSCIDGGEEDRRISDAKSGSNPPHDTPWRGSL